MSRSQDLKKFRETSLINYLENNGIKIDSKIEKDEKIKLCSSDNFVDVAKEFEEKYYDERGPIMISHVGGFYVTASLAGLATNVSLSKPYLLFFDRKSVNVENAIFNSLLMQLCDSKEEYICNLFNLSKIDIIKVLDPSLCVSYIEEVLADELQQIEEERGKKLNKTEKKQELKRLYEQNKKVIDEQITRDYITKDLIDKTLKVHFDLAKIEKHAKSLKYDDKAHYEMLQNLAKEKLSGKEYKLFCNLASDITEYLLRAENYYDLVGYLTKDIKINGEKHILANDEIYKGYKALFTKRGSNVKFVSGIDISTEKGVKKLEEVLKKDGFIGDSIRENEFAIDVAFTPHIAELKEAYPFLKKTVQDYIMLSKNGKRKKANQFLIDSTASLYERTLENIGASFIKEERANRKPLENLYRLETREGLPPVMFIAGANFGNIYHSEVDTYNMIDMAIENKVDTVYIRGLIYSTHYHYQTSRRDLIDPTYETLDSRLKMAKEVIEKLNKAGIKVVYQMGDEEYHLFQDIFKMYLRELGEWNKSNLLERNDLNYKHDMVKTIIRQDLIPYLIRSGEDMLNLATDNPNKTKVLPVCNALKRYKEKLPLGDLAKYIKPEFLKDTEMFKVVYSTVDKYEDNLSIHMLSNPNFSTITQYGRPEIALKKRSKMYPVGKPGESSELFVDARQGFMSIGFDGDRVVMNVPQMINDKHYLNQELLPGIKEHIKEDPTHKRVTQIQTRPNYPGGWIVSGDVRDRMIVMPYYKRVKELMDYVQKTGQGMPIEVVGNINDWQFGSPTERPEYDVKFLDYLFHECGVTGLIIDGDLQQGHNYKKYSNESRHMAAASMTQQMVSFDKILRPYTSRGFGVIDMAEHSINQSLDTTQEIIDHLYKIGLVEKNAGTFKSVSRVKRDIDYKTVDLQLPNNLKPYEKEIREKLSKIINLKFALIARGNHEENSDWDCKGYDETELLRQELESLQRFSGSDIDLSLSEFIINGRGDLVNAAYGCVEINGYRNIFGHSFKPGGKGGGATPTVNIAKWLEQMSNHLPRIDKVNSAHFHIYESSVIDNTLVTITGGGAGQSGYEQILGYSSKPIYVIDRYLPDGRFCHETIGTEFLDEYKIQNPYVKEMGLDNFIQECMTEEAPIFAEEAPKEMQKIYQRKIRPKSSVSRFGPKVD